MNKLTKILRICIPLLLCLFIVFKLILLPKIRYRQVNELIRNADHPTLLKACRGMIDNKDNFTDEPCGIWNAPNIVCFSSSSPQWTETVPEEIRSIAPTGGLIIITSNSLDIYPYVVPRTGLLAFSEGAEQRGTKKLIDGLWVLNIPKYDDS